MTAIDKHARYAGMEVLMLAERLADAPVIALPEGYSMRMYAPGDVEPWVKIQLAAEPNPLFTPTLFWNTYENNHVMLAERLMFLVGPEGADIGTITAWADDKRDDRYLGRIHWVAIDPRYQGRGLANGMLSAAIQKLVALGHTQAYLSTSTARVPAVNLYRKFGFAPWLFDEAQAPVWEAFLPLLRPLAPDEPA